MEDFYLYNKHNVLETKYGTVSIKNIIFDVEKIEKMIPDIFFRNENISFVFQEENLTTDTIFNIYKRFIPKEKYTNLEIYINESIKNNKNFFSFFAEGLLGVVYKDIYGFRLSTGLIDMNHTLNDTHSGVDACMYDLDNNIIILGEAKFYIDLKEGIKQITDDFQNKNIINKIDSLQRMSENNDTSFKIILKNLKKNKYDEINICEFLQQKLTFAGFVLHNHNQKHNYKDKDFYNNFKLDVKELIKNIENRVPIELKESNIEIVLLHLPISCKYQLIKKVIEYANQKIDEIRKENKE